MKCQERNRYIWTEFCRLEKRESRDPPSSDLVFRTFRVRAVSADFLSPAIKTNGARVDRPGPKTFDENLGLRQSGLRSRGQATAIRHCRQPLADRGEFLHGEEGLGSESHRLGDFADIRSHTIGVVAEKGIEPWVLMWLTQSLKSDMELAANAHSVEHEEWPGKAGHESG